MKLYYAPGACSLSAHIVLCASGLAFTTEGVDLGSKKTASGADYNAINPKSYVPALILDDGQLLTEIPAILQYLADLVPERQLAPPPGSFARVRVQEWLGFISSELHKTFSPLWHAAAEETKTAARARLERWFDWLEPQFGQRPFVTGEQFSIVDAYMYTVLNWTHHLKLPLDRWPQLAAYIARIGARPAVQAALDAERPPR